MGCVDISEIKWSSLIYALFFRSSSPSTVPVQRGTPEKIGNMPAMDRVLYHSGVEHCMLEAYLGN